MNRRNGRIAYALVADVGPRDKLGEGSIALAAALGIPSSPKKGGTRGGIVVVVSSGSGDGKPRPAKVIDAEGKRLFDEWGGAMQMDRCPR